MLNRIIQLTKVSLKSGFSFVSFSKKKKFSIGMIILYLFLLVYLGGVMGVLSYQVLDLLKAIDQTAIFITLLMAGNLLMTFFETVISSMNILYFSKDNEYILPLPFKAPEIVAAKINTLLFFSYFLELVLAIIPFTVYGVTVGAPWFFYVAMIIVALIQPIAPVILSSLLVMILMSFSKVVKNKGLLQILGMLFIFAFSIGISLISSSSSEISSSALVQMLMSTNGLVQAYRGVFPTLGFAIDALCATNLLDCLISLVLLIGVSALIYFAFITLSQKLYFRGVVGCLYSSSGTSKKKIDTKTAYRTSGLSFSYVAKEFKSLLRNTVYLTQIALPSIIVPIIMVVVFYFSFSNGVSQGGGDMNIIFQVVREPEFATIIYAIIMCYSLFTSLYIYVSITAISKDGSSAIFMKYIPVSFAKQCIYKAIPNFLFLMLDEVFTIILCAILKMPIEIIIISVMTFIPYSILHSLIGVLIDLRKPKLNWSSEMQLVKQNFRIFFISLFAIINLGLMIIPFFVSEIPFYYIGGIYFFAYTLLAIGLIVYINKKDNQLAQNII